MDLTICDHPRRNAISDPADFVLYEATGDLLVKPSLLVDLLPTRNDFQPSAFEPVLDQAGKLAPAAITLICGPRRRRRGFRCGFDRLA